MQTNIPLAFQQENIQIVNSFQALIAHTFQGQNNALCWHRDLQGDFQEIVHKLQLQDNITEVTKEDLLALDLSAAGNTARTIILQDIEALEKAGAAPNLNLLKCYERDEEFDFIATDVYSFHVDRAPILRDTFLCTYHGMASDILPNEYAIQKVLIPEVRAQLKALHNGDENDFEDFLKEYFFDLHYAPTDESKIINLGKGHLWRLAVDSPQQKVLPAVHRAPIESDGQYRLLLIC